MSIKGIMAISTSDSDKKYRDQTGPGRCSGKQEIYNSKWGKILSLCCVHIYGSSFTTGKNHYSLISAIRGMSVL